MPTDRPCGIPGCPATAVGGTTTGDDEPLCRLHARHATLSAQVYPLGSSVPLGAGHGGEAVPRTSTPDDLLAALRRRMRRQGMPLPDRAVMSGRARVTGE